jgi:Trypsin
MIVVVKYLNILYWIQIHMLFLLFIATNILENIDLAVIVNFTQFGDLSFSHARNVTRIVVHPNFKQNPELKYHANDIALLFLDSPVLKTTPVALNNNRTNPEDDDVLTTLGVGWGYQSYEKIDELLEVDLRKVNDDTCQYLYRLPFGLDSIICAAVQYELAGTCLYDEGR